MASFSSKIKTVIGERQAMLAPPITNTLSPQELVAYCGELNVVGLVFESLEALRGYKQAAGSKLEQVNLLVTNSAWVELPEVDGLVLAANNLSEVKAAAKLPALENKPLIAKIPAHHSLAIEMSALAIDALWFELSEGASAYASMVKWWVNYSTLPVIAQSDNNEQHLAELVAANPDMLVLCV